jgi:hypothetical protein
MEAIESQLFCNKKAPGTTPELTYINYKTEHKTPCLIKSLGYWLFFTTVVTYHQLLFWLCLYLSFSTDLS